MKKLILSFCLFSFAFCGFSQTAEDNSAYVPTKVEVKQSTEKNVTPYAEPLIDTMYCCRQTKIDSFNVQLSRQKDEIIFPYNKPLNSQEYFEKERQSKLEQTKYLYRLNDNYYADRLFRYGFQILTQTIFPF